MASKSLSDKWVIEFNDEIQSLLIINLDEGISFDFNKYEIPTLYNQLSVLKTNAIDPDLLYPLQIKNSIVIYLSKDDIECLLENIPMNDEVRTLISNLCVQEGCYLLQ